MAKTALDYITRALTKLQVYAAGETLSSDDSALGLAVLNDMLDSWSNENLSCFHILEQNAALTVNKYQYTIGSGGDFNMTRPLRILQDPGTAYLLDTNGNRYPVAVRTRVEWNLIGNIVQVNSNVPTDLFYDPQFPLGVINVFPIPNISWTLYWDSDAQLSDFATLATSASLPPGYDLAIIDNLAVFLFPYFKARNAQLDPDTRLQANISKGNIQRTNIKNAVAFYDPEIVARPAQSTYNIYRDTGR